MKYFYMSGNLTSICWWGESADHYTIYDETIALSLPWSEQLIFAFNLICLQSFCLSTYSKITSRCYFTEVTRKSHRVAISSKYSKSHRVAISDEINQNHTALLFHMKLLKITLRCYFTRKYSKSYRVAISMKVWIVFRELMIFILNGKKFQWNHISIRRRLGGKWWIETFPKIFF